MNRKMTVTAQALRAWLGIPPSWNISLGLPVGARVDGEEDVILYVDVEIPTARAPETVTGREAKQLPAALAAEPGKPATCETCGGSGQDPRTGVYPDNPPQPCPDCDEFNRWNETGRAIPEKRGR